MYQDYFVSGAADAVISLSASSSLFCPAVINSTNLDIFIVVCKASTLDSEVHGVIILPLIFAKAYDTLQRAYLLSALTRLGFSPYSVSVVAALHVDTT